MVKNMETEFTETIRCILIFSLLILNFNAFIVYKGWLRTNQENIKINLKKNRVFATKYDF